MATNRNIVEMVEAIRQGNGGNTGNGAAGIYLAKVQSVKPLTIKMHDSVISSNLYLNQSLVVGAVDNGVGKAFLEPFEPKEAYEFLKEFHEKFVLKNGDTVVVYFTGSSFYIAGKAVRS